MVSSGARMVSSDPRGRPGRAFGAKAGQAGSVAAKLKALEHLLAALIGLDALRSPDDGRAIGRIK
jgi:hypothetical protein